MKLCSTSLLTILATLSVLAQDVTVATESFRQTAERWGLWAAVTLVLVMAVLYAYWRQTIFVEKILVKLIEDNQRCIQANTSALRNAPCGREKKDHAA